MERQIFPFLVIRRCMSFPTLRSARRFKPEPSARKISNPVQSEAASDLRLATSDGRETGNTESLLLMPASILDGLALEQDKSEVQL